MLKAPPKASSPILCLLLAAAAAMAPVAGACAQQQLPDISVQAAAPPPVKDYARFPDYGQPVLSPNGKYLAVLVPINERMNLAVIDIDARSSTVLTGLTGYDVFQVTWVGNDRLVFSLGQQNTPTGPGVFDGGGLFMVSRDGKESRRLAPSVREMRAAGQFVGRGMQLLGLLPDSESEVLVSSNQRSADARDVYRLDVATGRTRLVTTTRPERTERWVLDRKAVPRVAMSSVKDELEQIVHYRASENEPWTELTRIKDFDSTAQHSEMFIPLAFDNDNEKLLVASNRGRDTMAIWRYDPKHKRFEDVVAGHPRYDMGINQLTDLVPGLVLMPRTREVLGYAVEAEFRQNVWVNEEYALLQSMVDKALPGRVNTLQRADTGDRAVVTSYNAHSSPEYFLFHTKARRLEPIAVAMPWLTERHLVEMKPFVLKTRDGLEIPSYYFLPRNHKPGQRLPTVVHVHGGPHSRSDRWGPLWLGGSGVAEAQVLASRGYAVVLPNFRITPGLGRKVYFSGYGAVGRQMSEDHEDAAKWAVDQGFADPQRMCISGASYGGYATLMALAKTPDLFKCGMAGLVVSDMELQLKSTAGDTVYSEEGVQHWHQLLGEDDAPGTARSVSPVHLAERIKAPVFLYAGAADVRTPIEQTNRMVNALRKAGHKPEVMIKADEGHGFGKLDNRTELYEKMLQFLDRHIGAERSAR